MGGGPSLGLTIQDLPEGRRQSTTTSRLTVHQGEAITQRQHVLVRGGV